MNKEQHRQHHEELHKAVDELVADFISQTEQLLTKTSIMDILIWSHGQTKNPTGTYKKKETKDEQG